MAKPELSFGMVLRELRHKQGMSQENFAFECGLNRQFISLLELGQQSPSLETIYKLARGLGLQGSELLVAVETVARKKRRGTWKPGDGGS